MKTWLVLAAQFISPAIGFAEPSLAGTWKSDREISAAFNDAHSRLAPKTADFLRQSMGRLTLTITANEIAYVMPDFEATIEGSNHAIVGFSERHPYKILATTNDSLAILTTEPVSHAEVVVVYNFDGADRMWLYIKMSDLNIREYFTRVH